MTWQGIEGGYAGDSSERSTGNSYRAERADRAGQRVGLVVGAGYWADLGRKHCCRDLHGSAGFGDPGIVFFFRSSIQATSWWIDMRWVLVFQLLFFSQAACSSRPARPVARKPNKLRYLQLRWSLITRCAAEADRRSWMLLVVGLLLVSWLHLLSGGFIGGPQVEFGHIWKLQKKVCLIRIGHV